MVLPKAGRWAAVVLAYAHSLGPARWVSAPVTGGAGLQAVRSCLKKGVVAMLTTSPCFWRLD